MANNRFVTKNCAMAVIATGEYAGSLIELKDRLPKISLECIYYHFWGGRLFPQFTHSDYHNDFAIWAHEVLHDDILAERLGIIDPTAYDSLEGLRNEVIEIVDERLDEYPSVPWTKKEDQFHFLRSSIIIFDSPHTLTDPKELPVFIPKLSLSSIFFHFIDARTRTPEKKDDFSTWLSQYGNEYSLLIKKLEEIDPYFYSLSELKEEIERGVNTYIS